MTNTLADQITQIILQLIDNEIIDREEVRQIALGLSDDGQSINIWQSDEWDDYEEFADYEGVIAQIDNSQWLNAIDEIGYTRTKQENKLEINDEFLPNLDIYFDNPIYQQIYLSDLQKKIEEIKSALKEIARKQSLGSFEKLLGLYGVNLSNCRYAKLVCFYHPEGTQIFPSKERRLPGYSSLYGYMAFVDEGLIQFYTDEDDFDEDDDIDQYQCKTYHFSDMSFYTDTRRDGLVFQLKSSGQQIEFDAGHTTEEHGDADSHEIEEMIYKHFEKHVEKLCFTPEEAPLYSDKEAWQRWFFLYTQSSDKLNKKIIENSLKRDDHEAIQAILDANTFTKTEMQNFNVLYILHYLNKSDYSSVLDYVAQSNSESFWNTHWNAYYRALIMDGAQYQKVYSTALTEYKKNEKARFVAVHTSFMTIAGLQLGLEEYNYQELLERKSIDDFAPYKLALALINADKPELCRNYLIKAFRLNGYKQDYLAVDFEKYPQIKAQAEQILSIIENKDSINQQVEEYFLLNGDTEKREVYNPFNEAIGRWKNREPSNRLRLNDLEGDVSFRSAQYTDATGTWVSFEKGFAKLEPTLDSFTMVNRHDDDLPYWKLTVQGQYIYATTYDELKVFTFHGTDSPELVATQALVYERPDAIFTDDSLLIISSGTCLEFYNLADKGSPKLIHILSICQHIKDYANSYCIHKEGERLYISLDKRGVLLLDITNPCAPETVSFLPYTGEVKNMDVKEGVALLYSAQNLLFADYSNPFQPIILEDVLIEKRGYPLVQQYNETDFVLYGSTYDASFYSLRFSPIDKVLKQESFLIFESEIEREVNIDYMEIVVCRENRFSVFHEDICTDLIIEPMPTVPIPTESQLTEISSHLETWMLSQLEALIKDHKGIKIGHCHFSIFGNKFNFSIDGQKSYGTISGKLAARDEDIFPQFDFFEPLSDISDSSFFKDININEDSSLAEWISEALESKWKSVFLSVIEKITQLDIFKENAPGRVFLTNGPNIYGLQDNGGEWKPWRAKIAGIIERPLEEILNDYSNWDSYAKKCDEDEELKEELYNLARCLNNGALQVVRRRFNSDLDESLDVLCSVIQNFDAYNWMTFIRNYKEHKIVQETGQLVYDSLINKLTTTEDKHPQEWVSSLVEAAQLCDKQESTELEAIVDLLLFESQPDYVSYDAIVKYLASRKDISPLKEKIQKAVDAMDDNNNRLAAMSEQLFRSGAYTIPQGLIFQAIPQKSGEQYSDINFGLKFLDAGPHQYEEPRIQRLFTGHAILENIRKASDANTIESIWPKGAILEEYPASWKYLLKSILSQMDIDTELDLLITVLSKRLSDRETFHAEIELFGALISVLVESREFERLVTITAMLAEHPTLASDEKLKSLNNRRIEAEIQIAWNANSIDDLETAKVYTNKLVAEGVKNPLLYFLEARLAWKESNNPQEAIIIAEKHLPVVHGGVGKARLLNLVGCAHDELKEYELALKHFQLASDNDPSTSFYFDNIAEICEKMGEHTKAVEWAKEAKRRGSKSAIISKIIGE